MKMRSTRSRPEQAEGSNRSGKKPAAEDSESMRQRRRRKASVLGDSKSGDCVSGGTTGDESGKGEGSKKRKRGKVDVARGKHRNKTGSEKSNANDDSENGAPGRGTVKDVVLRSRCTLRTVSMLNGRMSAYHRNAVRGTALQPVLEYREMAMERHLTLALIQAWDKRRKAFKIAGRHISFTVFDVVLFTGLPGTGEKVELDGEEQSTQVGDMVRARMEEWERQEMQRRVPGKSGQKRRYFRNYVNVMVELCEENAGEDRVRIWLQLYAFIVLSGVLFPRTPYGAAWSLLRYVEDVEGMGQFAWAEAVWAVVVDMIEETQRKLRAAPLSEVQLNGFCLLIQV